MYPMTVIRLFWAQNSFSVAHRFCLPLHIFKESWILAILHNILSSTSHIISRLYSVFLICNAWLSPSSIPFLSWANCLLMTFSTRAFQVVFDCLQLIKSHPTEQLATSRHHVVWLRMCCMPHQSDRHTLNAFPYIGNTSCWYLESKIYS